MTQINLSPIGIIRSPFKTKKECPIQSAVTGALGEIHLNQAYLEALETIESFSHLYLLYRFDQAGDILLSRPTFLDDSIHGVFASRHPCRPNGIGLSIVELLAVDGPILKIRGIDVLDNTPLIDIKPYIPRFDHRPNANNGWIEAKPLRKKPDNRE